jgi:flagellar basal body rod protein FlgG
MIYGLYLSATGVLTNSFRQDVIANNLANAETVGFKRDLALFHERLTESQERRLPPGYSDPMLEMLGGGVLASPMQIDRAQGELEPTGNTLDVAIQGDGYFKVSRNGETRLTRDGRFALDTNGQMVMADGSGYRVLDPAGNPIYLDPRLPTTVGEEGVIGQRGAAVAQIGLFDVPDPTLIAKEGDNLLSYPDIKKARAIQGTLRSEFVERANVDPALELTQLMEAQRQLEANANMIRYQDQTLSRLVNEVGKIG